MIAFESYASSSAGNLYSVTDGETMLMIDCGLPWPKAKKAFGFKTSSVKAVLLGHEHGDHSRGIEGAASAGIDIYLLPETKANLGLSGHRYHEIKLLEQFSIGTLEVLPFPLQHDVPNCGFLIADRTGDKLCYINDSFYCKYRFKGVGIYAIGCNYSKRTMSEEMHPAQRHRLLRAHLSLETLLDFLDANDMSMVRELHLLHLSDENADEAYFREQIQGKTGIPVIIEAR